MEHQKPGMLLFHGFIFHYVFHEFSACHHVRIEIAGVQVMRLYVVILQGPCTLHQWPARECTSCTVCSEHEAPTCGLREHLTVPVQYHAAYRAFESFFVQAQIFHDAIPVQVDPGLSQRDSEKYTFILKIDAAQPVCIYYLCAFVASDAVVDDLFQLPETAP